MEIENPSLRDRTCEKGMGQCNSRRKIRTWITQNKDAVLLFYFYDKSDHDKQKRTKLKGIDYLKLKRARSVNQQSTQFTLSSSQ